MSDAPEKVWRVPSNGTVRFLPTDAAAKLPGAVEYIRADIHERLYQVVRELRAVEDGLRAENARLLEALDRFANKAAWMLDHGATNEERDLCEDIITTRRALEAHHE